MSQSHPPRKNRTRKKRDTSKPIVRYRGASYLQARLPRQARDWSDGGRKSIAPDGDGKDALIAHLSHLNTKHLWSWPKARHYFLTDLHGDTDAFVASLVATGGIKKTGPSALDFRLTNAGRDAVFIIGGDCFDKGPSSLNLLRAIKFLKSSGAHVRILAGNHDVRVKLGLASIGHKRSAHNEHFFIRTGQKIIPLLLEIWTHHVQHANGLKGVPSKKECRKRLYPSDAWYDNFPQYADGVMRPAQLKRELHRIRKKQERFENQCEAYGLSLRHVYAAALMWQDLFLKPDGEFHWFYRKMRLAYRAGSFLFVHAGLDNHIAKRLHNDGVKTLNTDFRKALNGKPFDFYYGSLCNTIRTKYRDVDQLFTHKGARHVRQAGINAIIHGHRNLHHGQRIALRHGLLNFECDATVDQATRKKENVRGRGGAATIVEPKGRVLGVSSDYPYIKVFEPETTLRALKNQTSKQRRHS